MWQNPRGPSRALLLWGNDGLEARKRKWVDVPYGEVALSVPIGDECVGGCDAQLLLLAPYEPGSALPVAQPASQMLDLTLPGATLLPAVRLDVDTPAAMGAGSVELLLLLPPPPPPPPLLLTL